MSASEPIEPPGPIATITMRGGEVHYITTIDVTRWSPTTTITSYHDGPRLISTIVCTTPSAQS